MSHPSTHLSTGLQAMEQVLAHTFSPERVDRAMACLSSWSLTELWQAHVSQWRTAGLEEPVIAFLLDIKRLFVAVPEDRVFQQRFKKPTDIVNYARALLAWEQREILAVLYLNTRNEPVSFEKLFHGGIDQAIVCTCTLAKRALTLNASRLVCIHNHPCDQATPSAADIRITERIAHALELLDIDLLDHLIVTKTGFFSFMEEGMLR